MSWHNDVLVYARRDGISNIAAVVSGLPLKLIDRKAGISILRKAFDLMGASGSFVQFTYSHRPPIPLPIVDELGLKARNVGFVWRNLPPASIWEFRRRPCGPLSRRGGVSSTKALPCARLLRAADVLAIAAKRTCRESVRLPGG